MLVAKPETPVDVTQKEVAEKQRRQNLHRARVSAAGGELLGAVFNFLGELVTQDDQTAEPPQEVVANLRSRLTECVEEDDTGQQRLSITLPNRETLDSLACKLARLLAADK